MYYKEQCKNKKGNCQTDVFGSNDDDYELCPDCHGSGSLQDNLTCGSCNGKGLI